LQLLKGYYMIFSFDQKINNNLLFRFSDISSNYFWCLFLAFTYFDVGWPVRLQPLSFLTNR